MMIALAVAFTFAYVVGWVVLLTRIILADSVKGVHARR